MKAYCINLNGMGDTEIKLVSEEVFKWITSPSGRPSDNTSIWIDKTTPQEVIDYHNKDGGVHRFIETDGIEITSGSWSNDRALQASPLTINGEEAMFFSLQSILEFCKKYDIEIIDTYEGSIY